MHSEAQTQYQDCWDQISKSATLNPGQFSATSALKYSEYLHIGTPLYGEYVRCKETQISGFGAMTIYNVEG
jgi:hypothetical protein